MIGPASAGGPVGRLAHDSFGARPSFSLDVDQHHVQPQTVVQSKARSDGGIPVRATVMPVLAPPIDTGSYDMAPTTSTVGSGLGALVGLAVVGGAGYFLWRWWRK